MVRGQASIFALSIPLRIHHPSFILSTPSCLGAPMRCGYFLRSCTSNGIRRGARYGYKNGIVDRPFVGCCSSQQRRRFGLDTLQTILLPPAVFGGLLVTLWTYKCLMMVIFQNKIIYMPSVPPFSRSEKIEDYEQQCRPVEWIEHETRSSDGTLIKLVEGSIRNQNLDGCRSHVVILYFQG